MPRINFRFTLDPKQAGCFLYANRSLGLGHYQIMRMQGAAGILRIEAEGTGLSVPPNMP